MALIPKFFVNSVAAIGLKNETGEIKWFGTGFFVLKKIEEDAYRVFFVSNKHVLQNKKEVFLRLTSKEEQIITIPMQLLDDDNKPLYHIHERMDIDVAVVPVNAQVLVDNFKFDGIEIDNFSDSSMEMLESGIDEGSFVFMLGYPMGLVDLESDYPICRLGCVARISSKEIMRTGNYLLDIQNFPGNSGSPVFSKPELVSIKGTKANKQCKLIGIIHSYIPYQENLINSQTGRIVEIKSENSGIANAHPVEYIRDIINSF